MSEPIQGHGKIVYLELPSRDVEESATFYRTVFGWNVRERGDGAKAFDDGVGQVSGVWVTHLQPAEEPGYRLYISADDAVTCASEIEAAGGSIVERVDPSAVDIVGKFRDPTGNLLGIHQYKPENA